MADNYRNGDCQIKTLTIESLDGKNKLNLYGQVSSIDIYESVMQPVIVGEIDIVDGISLMTNFPLIGEEVIKLEFLTPSMDTIKYTLHVWKYDNIQFSDNSKQRTYTAHVISKEGLINATKNVTKRMNKQISDSIKDIVTEYLKTDQKLDIEPTIGIDDHLMSNVKPLQMIDNLRHRAISAQYKSSSFAFWQDRDGFHFRTIEQMVEKANKPKFNYNYDDSMDLDITKDGRYDNIIVYQPVQTVNTLDRLQMGGITNITKRFDIITGETSDVAFSDSSDEFSKAGTTSRSTTSKFNEIFGQSTGTKPLVAFGEKASEQLNEKYSNLPGFAQRIDQNILNISIYGNSNVRIGDGMKITINASTGLTGTTGRQQENTYVVAKIRHSISVSAHPVYTQALELIGNSYDSK